MKRIIYCSILVLFFIHSQCSMNSSSSYEEISEQVLNEIITFELKFKTDKILPIYSFLNGNLQNEQVKEYINTFDTIFSTDDKEFMLEQFNKYKSKKISNAIKVSNSIELSEDTIINKSLIYLSTPLFTIDKSHSLTYLKIKDENYSEKWLLIHKKTSENWKLIGMKPV